MKISKIYVVYNAIPSIVLELADVISEGGIGNDDIQFNELGKYVSLLQQQQDALGEYVGVSKTVYTQNNTEYPAILFEATDVPPVVENPTPIVINVQEYTGDVEPITTQVTVSGNGLTPIINCEEDEANSIQSLYPGFLCKFLIPVVNIDREQNMFKDYIFPPVASVTYPEGNPTIFYETPGDGFYHVYMFFPEQTEAYTIQAKPYILVQAVTARAAAINIFKQATVGLGTIVNLTEGSARVTPTDNPGEPEARVYRVGGTVAQIVEWTITQYDFANNVLNVQALPVTDLVGDIVPDPLLFKIIIS